MGVFPPLIALVQERAAVKGSRSSVSRMKISRMSPRVIRDCCAGRSVALYRPDRRADRRGRIEKVGPRTSDRKDRTENDGRIRNRAQSAPGFLIGAQFSVRFSRAGYLGPVL